MLRMILLSALLVMIVATIAGAAATPTPTATATPTATPTPGSQGALGPSGYGTTYGAQGPRDGYER